LGISTVIFDMGGVLVWTHWERATEPLGKLARVPPERVLETILHTDAHFSYMIGEIDSYEFAIGILESLGIDIPQEELLAIWDSILAPNPEALPVLERLKKRYRLVLGSNTDIGHFNRSLEVQPGLGLFDDLLLSYELGVCKPDAAFFELGLASLEIPPEKCVFIDDLAANIESAKGVGIKAIQFQSMSQVEAELGRLGLL